MPQSEPDIVHMRLLLAIAWFAGLGCGLALADGVPLPRPRPAMWTEPHSFAEAAAGAGPDFNSAAMTAEPTDCDKRLAAMAVLKPMPRLIGPGACGGADMVELDAVLTPDKARIAVKPAALLNCGMAESLASWLRDEVAPRAAKLGSPLNAIENYDSYECRPRNRLVGAKLSEHAHGEALDVRALHLADGRRLELTDPNVDKPLRQALHDTACHRFTTVLGPGEPFHEGHIHLDVIARRGGYRICEWDVREPGPPAIPLPRPRPALADAR
jgi:hypothetical protein